MKRLFSILICIFFLISLSACNKSSDTQETQPPTQAQTENSDNTIIGTWVCEDINEDCYFIFDENGDAFAKWGTTTVYGYFDYYDDEDYYEIDVPNFLYNDYKVTFSGDEMVLKSDESSYEFIRATMPEIKIEAPDELKLNKKLLGDWQSQSSYECYRFNEDNTAVITDMMNYATIDCKYSCEDGTITMYYMVTEKEGGSRELKIEFINSDKIKINDYEYEKVDTQ